MKEARGEEDGEAVCPGGSRVLREGSGVVVDSEAVVEDCGREALLDVVVDAYAYG